MDAYKAIIHSVSVYKRYTSVLQILSAFTGCFPHCQTGTKTGNKKGPVFSGPCIDRLSLAALLNFPFCNNRLYIIQFICIRSIQ